MTLASTNYIFVNFLAFSKQVSLFHSRSSARRNQIEIPVETQPVFDSSQNDDSSSPSDDIFNKHERLLRHQREANRDVSKWVSDRSFFRYAEILG